jgi:hypothetical protein
VGVGVGVGAADAAGVDSASPALGAVCWRTVQPPATSDAVRRRGPYRRGTE